MLRRVDHSCSRTSVVLYIVVDEGPTHTPDLHVRATWTNPTGGAIPYSTGPSPHLFRHDFTGDEAWNAFECDGGLLVRLDHGKDIPQVAVDTPFHVAVGLVYNGAEVPDGYVPGE
ncbi:MAG: hypothetical protein KY455_12725 [Euryarchaeota archaeon]|nr:hypothetical protein [Euryarchaeota archaeon]